MRSNIFRVAFYTHVIPFLLIILSSANIFGQNFSFDGNNNGVDPLIELNDSECNSCKDFNINHISNPSFEEELCPPFVSSIHCAPGWSEVGIGTPDFLDVDVPWYNLVAGPYDGTNYLGSSSGLGVGEMFTNCLVEPLLADQTYELSFKIGTIWSDLFSNFAGFPYNFSPSVLDFEIIGLVDCVDESTTYDVYECPTEIGYAGPDYEVLVEYQYTPIEENWTEINLQITPTQDIYALIFGTLCQSETLPVALGDEEGMRFYNFYDDFSLTLTPPIGLEEIQNQTSLLSVYPNPFKNNLEFKVNNHDKYVVRVYSSSGLVKYSNMFTNNLLISTDSYESGFYIYEVLNDYGIVKRGKVVKY